MIAPTNVTDIAIVGMAARLPDDPFEFDARFFGCTETDAAELDPQHRLFLECAYHALERASHVLDRWDGVAGIYGATNMSWYYLRHVYPRAGHDPLFGNTPDGLVARAAYELNVTGPCVAVQAACASSLVAVHMACQDLLGYQCDLAIAGGVSVDEEAAGTGVVVLRRLADALASGDHVHAVIKGSAVANDGRRRVGPTGYGSAGARDAALAALAVAGAEPEDVGHVEPHRPGDATEAALWDEVYPAALPGSAGSTELGQAAAVVSLIRTALAVEHGWEPSVAGFPSVGSLSVRSRPDGRLAGVAASGSGGMHAHVLLGRAPRRLPVRDPAEWQLLPLSAKTPEALGVIADELRAHLRVNDVRLADVAHTLRVGRRELGHRTFAVCRDGEFEVAPVTRPDFASLVFSFTGEQVESDVLAARRLMNAGIRPVAVLGTGFGEYTAACVAGTLSLDEALALAKARECQEKYEKAVCNAQPRAGDLPLLSGATGAVVTEEEVTDQRRWLAMMDEMCPPLPIISAFVVDVSTAVDERTFLALVGSVWARGAEVDWDALSADGVRRVPLPGYPFERRRFHLP